MRILIARHAQTKENENNIIQESKASLNENSINQISKLINRLEKEKIDLVISSDFDRCKITAEKVAEKFNIPIEYDNLLREKYDGDWIGKSTKEVNWDSLEGTVETRRAPNGENPIEVRERARKFFKKVLDKYKETNKTILVVSHATILRLFVGNLLGLNIEDSIFNFTIDNCSLTEIDINPKYRKGHRINYLNEKSFLSR